MAPVVLLGAGRGGAEELAGRLDAATVSWALVSVPPGSWAGQTCNKLVVVHSDGEETPSRLRGWLNARKEEPLGLLGAVDATVRVERPEEVSTELLRGILAPPPLAASEASPEEALRAVGEDMGELNWALLEPAGLGLHASGAGGIEEMVENLADDKVLFGVLRLSFGCRERDRTRLRQQGRAGHHSSSHPCLPSSSSRCCAAPRLTRFVFVRWAGPGVAAVQRGRWNAQLPSALAMVSAHCTIALRKEARSREDLGLEGLLADVRRLTALGAEADGSGVARISEEEYRAALRQEAAARDADAPWVPPEMVRERGLQSLPELREVLRSIREASGEWHWAVLGWRGPVAAAGAPGASGGA